MSLLAGVQTKSDRRPSRIFFYAREKWGKSSLFAYAPKPVYFMTRGETGLLELIDCGRLPQTPHFAYDDKKPPTWQTLRQAVSELIRGEHDHRTFILDTCNGAVLLLKNFIRETQFNNDQAAYASYGKGDDACAIEWFDFQQDLDLLRATRRMGIVLIAHTAVKKFDDPIGGSFDKYEPEIMKKLWAITHKWADIIAFGQFATERYKDRTSGTEKAKTTARRVIEFNQSPLWDAGNRYGIVGQINADGGAEKAWKAFAATITKARGENAGKPETQAGDEAGSQPPAANEEQPTGFEDPPEIDPPTQGPSEHPEKPATISDGDVITHLASINRQWSNPEHRKQVAGIIGREITDGESISSLTQDERSKLIDRCQVAKKNNDDKAAKAAATKEANKQVQPA